MRSHAAPLVGTPQKAAGGKAPGGSTARRCLAGRTRQMVAVRHGTAIGAVGDASPRTGNG
ncbi:hypothetical protein KZ829_13420 [Actinoplanes hulinensis]|uniref:Uncharacterized protein n=1 Tax=Actinoplanes hulinensis TaxID=1144547 RepID=A0ABS7B1D7_9ACTN|nr:hypothetical protein [Actinoplanes hulinensis]MBW6434737.1 hypothetical protein [Actinoplanes hulinensis]